MSAHLMVKGLFHLVPESVLIVGYVETDGSGDPGSVDASKLPGVASVARSSNRYTVTLDDKYQDLLLGIMCPEGKAPETAQATGTDVAAGTVAFDTGGTHVSLKLWFALVLKNTADAF